jgi:ribokinase
MKVIVFGSLNMDLSINCERIPGEGETVEGDSFLVNPGGKGANQAVAASRLGADVVMCGAVGKDDFGEVMIGCMEGAGVDTTHIKRTDEHATGTAIILRNGGNNRIVIGHGANFHPKREDVLKAIEDVSEPGDIFLTQFENDYDVVKAAIKDAHDHGLFTMLNPAPAREIDEDLWPYIDFICMNETECKIVTGIYPYGPDDARQAELKLADKGVKQIVVTLGERGVSGYDGTHSYFINAHDVEATDTTGAGDTFIGALIAARADGVGFEDSLRFATKASALAVTRLGAMQSIPSKDEVVAFEVKKG